MISRTLATAGLALLGAAWLAQASRATASSGAAQPPEVAAGSRQTLAQVVEARPFREYGQWWPIGDRFATFMSEAIVGEWSALPGHDRALGAIQGVAADYIRTVYGRAARPTLVEDFATRRFTAPLQSGEFDALSYAFYKSAFEVIARRTGHPQQPVEVERRLFTRRVGKAFFGKVHDHLRLSLPAGLDSQESFSRLKEAIDRVGTFLKEQGYFRDHVAFRFDVDRTRSSGKVVQSEAAFLERVERREPAYALFEMGYPVILPSAVYLFGTVGEAQHHSSRTIEELFDRVGCDARETDDFNPSGYPSDMVVELWRISRR